MQELHICNVKVLPYFPYARLKGRACGLAESMHPLLTQLVVLETQGMHTLSRALPDFACAPVLNKLGTEQDQVYRPQYACSPSARLQSRSAH